MDRAVELELIGEVLALQEKGEHFLEEGPRLNRVGHYFSSERFAQEREAIFLKLPFSAAHSSELHEAGSFLQRQVHGQPVLITRDKQGEVRAFLNVCRHRGAQLVAEESGCKNRFSCPYHAWTYGNDGRLIAAPHFADGFAGIDKSELGLTQLPCKEAFGFIWVVPSICNEFDWDDHFGQFGKEVDRLRIADHSIVAQDQIECEANWKILIEGGIESYHFKIAHRDTIGPFFEDNLSTYRSFGDHLRSVLPRVTLASLKEVPEKNWRLRDHANLIYTFFPTVQLLVQQDHIIWITMQPTGPDSTQLRLVTLAPVAEAGTEKDEAYWQRNHSITMTTLREDFVIGEGIQRGLASGANSHFHFGRFEGALDAFKRSVSAYCDGV